MPCSLAVRPIGLLQELLISGDVLGMECSVTHLRGSETPYEALIPASASVLEASPLGDYLCFEGPHAITALKVFLSFES